MYWVDMSVAATQDRPGSSSAAARAAVNRDSLLVVGVIVLGALLRFWALGQQNFWSDEVATHTVVAGSLGHVFSTLPKTEGSPPLYYVAAWTWSRLFGTGEVGLRSLSALCGTLTIPVVWALGRRLVSERVGLIAALLTAVSPLLFWYSQEARAYSLFALLGVLS